MAYITTECNVSYVAQDIRLLKLCIGKTQYYASNACNFDSKWQNKGACLEAMRHSHSYININADEL